MAQEANASGNAEDMLISCPWVRGPGAVEGWGVAMCQGFKTHGLARSESGSLREEDRHCASHQPSQPGKLNRVDAHDKGCCTQEPNDTERVISAAIPLGRSVL